MYGEFWLADVSSVLMQRHVYPRINTTRFSEWLKLTNGKNTAQPVCGIEKNTREGKHTLACTPSVLTPIHTEIPEARFLHHISGRAISRSRGVLGEEKKDICHRITERKRWRSAGRCFPG